MGNILPPEMSIWGRPETIDFQSVKLAIAFKKLAIPFLGERPEHKSIQANIATVLSLRGERDIAGALPIIEYLEDRFPAPALFPIGAQTRATCREVIDTLQSASFCIRSPIREYLTNRFDLPPTEIENWHHHWLTIAFQQVEPKIVKMVSALPHNDARTPQIILCFLLPLLQQARATGFNLSLYHRLLQIEDKAISAT
ncbi:MAG: hypothetical protein AAF603_04470 [Pseudomonadota bacterium]